MKFAKAIGLDDKQMISGWVSTIQRGRDARLLEQHNFQTAYDALAGLEGFSEVRERNPLTGYTDLLILEDGSPAYHAAQALERELQNARALNENAYSIALYEAVQEFWAGLSRKDRLHYCARNPLDTLRSLANVTDDTAQTVDRAVEEG